MNLNKDPNCFTFCYKIITTQYARHRLKQVNKTNKYNQYESRVPWVLWLTPAPPFGTRRLTHKAWKAAYKITEDG